MVHVGLIEHRSVVCVQHQPRPSVLRQSGAASEDRDEVQEQVGGQQVVPFDFPVYDVHPRTRRQTGVGTEKGEICLARLFKRRVVVQSGQRGHELVPLLYGQPVHFGLIQMMMQTARGRDEGAGQERLELGFRGQIFMPDNILKSKRPRLHTAGQGRHVDGAGRLGLWGGDEGGEMVQGGWGEGELDGGGWT
ncbi:hypothetical protein TREMEDRAFT_72573 [Tremella mesenterica DSM 1558]|uniref:uncharacterized protein n=1 Tax=Tremella mesenterica (strain ATCC 24925 / CBS 8224 / DSM 1558 / NBRC 9311 / NRRL Y-6157 / RJB 2259-6 / UBC 559-6) TaxID=578456 RepID=UPI00032D4824|nr:uncharacterized protein TREMEDRAFT_72573 [Tremella mesenterica DSM 1558]EIW65572.1 hypothetical protein TREMEDRAFT_72573 [Tremella mesenterica DSM 1558]